MKQTEKKIIPIFYAADENYLPYLAVSICSLKENADRNHHYEIYVLNEKMDTPDCAELKKYEEEDFRITFLNVSAQIEEVKASLQLRDYYTGATYYRIFIADMFPQYEKALYIDGDTVLLGDVSELFNVDLQGNLIGAIPDGAVAAVPAFRVYTKEALGIDAEKYFNAGVILMNLTRFRKENFYQKFCTLLGQYKFSVAQDQDYLNVICKDKVTYIDVDWNRMPIGGDEDTYHPKLIHYNLTLKPWHYKNILFEEYFWYYAKKTVFYERICDTLTAYTDEKRAADAQAEKNLIALALKEAAREDNYYKSIGRAKEMRQVGMDCRKFHRLTAAQSFFYLSRKF
ncbi:MAG: glycosyltransferase family 8 protein [Clostridia bacterium]|nr:glycosyltransferase family 8 protein [Clostridia bacterium]